jgi:hypothetical protein
MAILFTESRAHNMAVSVNGIKPLPSKGIFFIAVPGKIREKECGG